MRPGYFIEIKRSDSGYLHQFGEIYTTERLHDLLGRGELIRPPFINAAHFDADRIESIFDMYAHRVESRPEFDRDLSFKFYLAQFGDAAQEFFLPWACGFQFHRDGVPIWYPMSSGGMVMRQSYAPEQKLSHLKLLLDTFLKETCFFICYSHGDTSFTLEVFRQVADKLPHQIKTSSTLPGSANPKFSTVLITRTDHELRILDDDFVMGILTKIEEIWGRFKDPMVTPYDPSPVFMPSNLFQP